jgi:hypothetical protein
MIKSQKRRLFVLKILYETFYGFFLVFSEFREIIHNKKILNYFFMPKKAYFMNN